MLSSPNSELDSLRVDTPTKTPNSAAASLSTLVALSALDKSQWVTIIQDHKLPIAVRDRDASRDVALITP
jgi:hypothetical protein